MNFLDLKPFQIYKFDKTTMIYNTFHLFSNLELRTIKALSCDDTLLVLSCPQKLMPHSDYFRETLFVKILCKEGIGYLDCNIRSINHYKWLLPI